MRPRAPRLSWAPTALGGVWLLVVVAVPVWALVRLAGTLTLAQHESEAIAAATWTGGGLAVAVAVTATTIALVLSRSVPPLALLALLLVSRASKAYGALALGLDPGWIAACLALIADLTPLAALVVALRWRTRPIELLEAAADLGAGPWTRFWAIDWPHLRPALFVAFVWTALQAIGDTVSFEVAGGGLSYTPGLLIRDALVRDAAPARAAVLVLLILALTVPCAWLIARELRVADGGRWRPPPRAGSIERGFGWAMFFALGLLPAALAAGAWPDGIGPGDHIIVGLIRQTTWIAALVGVLSGLGGLLLAIGSRGRRLSFASVAFVLPVAMPASAVGLLGLTTAATLGAGPGAWLTVLGLLPTGLGLGYLAARVLISTIPLALVEAAADLGADALSRFRTLWLPLGRPALVVAVVVVVAWVMGQAVIPSFTSGPGGDTLAVGLSILARGGEMEVVRRWSFLMVLLPLSLAWLIALSARRYGVRR